MPTRKTVAVTTYVVCAGSGHEVTEPTRDYTTAKTECLRLRAEDPCQFYHIEHRTAEVLP